MSMSTYQRPDVEAGATSPFGTAPSDSPDMLIPELSKGLTEEQAEKVSSALRDAESYVDTEISKLREEATRRYNGEPYGNEEPGRSRARSLDVRDTVMSLMPDLMRIFFGPRRVCEFEPTSAQTIEMAEQATDYIEHVVRKDNLGFLVLYNAFKDALVRKVGFVKFWWDESTTPRTEEIDGLDEEGVAAILERYGNSDEYTVSFSRGEDGGAISATVTALKRDGKARIACVPPEEILVNRRARSAEEFNLIAHRQVLTRSDLISMGYTPDEIEPFLGDSTALETNIEAQSRNQNQFYPGMDASVDKETLYTEAYMKLDTDGDGIDELVRVCCLGDQYKPIRVYPLGGVPIAMFCPEPEPHEFFGTSIADLTMDVQSVKTGVLRATLDSLAGSINPRMEVVEGQVNIADAMNTEVGALIRTKAPNMVRPIDIPFKGADAFAVLNYYDDLKQSRTGVSKAASGLDPDAMQSTTKAAVAATVSAANSRIELIARVFAETGMRHLFRGLLGLVVNNQSMERVIRLRGRWVPMAPTSWDADMAVSVDVAVGDEKEQQQVAILEKIIQQQEVILTTLGPQNPLVTMKQYRDTLALAIEKAGLYGPERFFKVIDEVSEQEMAQSAEETARQAEENDPAKLLAKVQIQEIQANILMKQAEMEAKKQEIALKDERERMEITGKLELQRMEIELKYGLKGAEAANKHGIEQQRFAEESAARQAAPPGPRSN